MKSGPPLLRFSSNLFSALLLIYPPEHRAAFSQEMNQVFRDLAREIYRERGLAGFLGLWMKTLFDLMKTALEERLKEATHMTKEKFIRLGGWSLILVGLLVIIYVTGDSYRPIERVAARIYTDLIFFYGNTLFFSIGLFALYVRYQRNLGILGIASLLAGAITGLFWFGIILLMSLFDPPRSLGNADYLFIIIGWFFPLLGLFFFGVDVMRRKYPLRWKILPLVPGFSVLISIFVGMMNAGTLPDPEASILLIVIGLSSILIGYMLQSDRGGESFEVKPYYSSKDDQKKSRKINKNMLDWSS